MQIANPQLRFPRVKLIEPNAYSYIIIAAEIEPKRFPIRLSKLKKRIIYEAKQICSDLQNQSKAIQANVFTTLLRPPGEGKFLQARRDRVHVAKYDFVTLIETQNPKESTAILQSKPMASFVSRLGEKSAYHFITHAKNARRIGDVVHETQGVFLFNFFYADNLEDNLGIWEYTAGWFMDQTGLDNSTLFLPESETGCEYSVINHCRWDSLGKILPSLIFKPSFRKYVLKNFEINQVAAMPILYRLA